MSIGYVSAAVDATESFYLRFSPRAEKPGDRLFSHLVQLCDRRVGRSRVLDLGATHRQ